MVTHEMTRADGNYAASKVFGEAMARHYSDTHGIPILCVRIGSVQKGDRPTRPRDYSVYLSTEGGRRVSILKWPEGALLNLG